MGPRIALIAAAASNGAIGLKGGMPWHISEDLKYFKRVTMGAPVIMGRKTYASIGSALPGRANIVITRNTAFSSDDADVVYDVAAGLRKAQAIAEIDGSVEVFVIGGAEVYAQALAAARVVRCAPPANHHAATPSVLLCHAAPHRASRPRSMGAAPAPRGAIAARLPPR